MMMMDDGVDGQCLMFDIPQIGNCVGGSQNPDLNLLKVNTKDFVLLLCSICAEVPVASFDLSKENSFHCG